MIENLDFMEMNDVVNALKYHYFGRTYFICNSNLGLEKKKKQLGILLDEFRNDELINSSGIRDYVGSIEEKIMDSLRHIDYLISVKHFKFPFRLPIFKSVKFR